MNVNRLERRRFLQVAAAAVLAPVISDYILNHKSHQPLPEATETITDREPAPHVKPVIQTNPINENESRQIVRNIGGTRIEQVDDTIEITARDSRVAKIVSGVAAEECAASVQEKKEPSSLVRRLRGAILECIKNPRIEDRLRGRGLF